MDIFVLPFKHPLLACISDVTVLYQSKNDELHVGGAGVQRTCLVSFQPPIP